MAKPAEPGWQTQTPISARYVTSWALRKTHTLPLVLPSLTRPAAPFARTRPASHADLPSTRCSPWVMVVIPWDTQQDLHRFSSDQVCPCQQQPFVKAISPAEHFFGIPCAVNPVETMIRVNIVVRMKRSTRPHYSQLVLGLEDQGCSRGQAMIAQQS